MLVLLIPVAAGSGNPPMTNSDCPAPQVSMLSQSAGSVSFTWNAVGSAYVVYYTRQGDNFSSAQVYTNKTSITFSGLSSGAYKFYFATVCVGEQSEIIIIEDLVI